MCYFVISFFFNFISLSLLQLNNKICTFCNNKYYTRIFCLIFIDRSIWLLHRCLRRWLCYRHSRMFDESLPSPPLKVNIIVGLLSSGLTHTRRRSCWGSVLKRRYQQRRRIEPSSCSFSQEALSKRTLPLHITSIMYTLIRTHKQNAHVCFW